MDRNIIWKFLTETAFFQSLTKSSQTKLKKVWPSLNDKQFINILHLVGLEQTMINFIMNQIEPVISMAKKDALKFLRTNLENASKKDDLKKLSKLLKNIQ